MCALSDLTQKGSILMKRIILATVAWTGLAAGAALADVQLPNQLPLSALETCPIVQAAVQQLQTEGYTGIVVHLATHHARVEATLGGEARMFRYECGQEGTRQAAVMFRDGGDDSVPIVDRTGAGDDGGKGGHGGNGPGRPHGGNGGTGAEPPETGSGSTSPEGGTGEGDTPTDQEGPS